MSIVLFLHDGLKLEIQGEQEMADKILRARRPIAVKSRKGGRTVLIRGREVMAAEIITAAEEAKLAAQAVAKAEAEAKKNPHPGREPRLVVPR